VGNLSDDELEKIRVKLENLLKHPILGVAVSGVEGMIMMGVGLRSLEDVDLYWDFIVDSPFQFERLLQEFKQLRAEHSEMKEAYRNIIDALQDDIKTLRAAQRPTRVD
jgi:predicted ribosome quality control (RQC) complex YloA/Tae2 family protein